MRLAVWIVELLNTTVRAELDSLPDDMLARFRRIVDLIQKHGLQRKAGSGRYDSREGTASREQSM
jgi:hypothetical protein